MSFSYLVGDRIRGDEAPAQRVSTSGDCSPRAAGRLVLPRCVAKAMSPSSSPVAEGQCRRLRSGSVAAPWARPGRPPGLTTMRSSQEGWSDSRAARCAGRCSARPTNPPSSGRAICSWVAPRPTRDHRGRPPIAPLVGGRPFPLCAAAHCPRGWRPLAPWLAGQRDLGVDEAGKVSDRPVTLPAVGSVRSRPRSIRLDDGRGPVAAARLGYARRPLRGLTGSWPSHVLAPVAITSVFADRRRRQTPLRQRLWVLRSSSLNSGLGAGGIQTPAVGRPLLLQPPPHAAIGRRERTFSLCADAWPPHPRTAQPNLNPPDPTPIRTECNSNTRIPRSGLLGTR